MHDQQAKIAAMHHSYSQAKEPRKHDQQARNVQQDTITTYRLES